MRSPIAKTLSVLSVLAIFGIFGFIAGITAVTAQEDIAPRIPDEIRNYVPSTPEPAFTKQELREMVEASRAAYKTQVPVIQDTLLNMASGARFDALIVSGHQYPVPGQEDLPPWNCRYT